MKKVNLFLILSLIIITNNIFAQGMQPPPPVESPFIDASLGTWVSEPYEMMGMKITDEVTHRKILNGQFMTVEIKGTGDNGFVYEALGIIAPSSDGSFAATFYDIFGKNAITTYSGTAKGTNVDFSRVSNWGTESRNIIIDGNTMTHNVTMTMKDPTGKEMPTQTFSVKYHKK